MEIKDSMKRIKNHLITQSHSHSVTYKKAFTLAEVMVVLFVLTVILAAFAPMMTTRTKVNKTSPWTYASPDTANAYFGMGPNQTVMIGQKTKPATDLANRLTVNTSAATQAHMLFKQGTNILGQLNLNNDSVVLGGSREALASGSGNSAIGVEALKLNTDGTNNTAIGYQAMLNNATGGFNTAVGTLALSDSTAGSYSTALGYNACDGVNANYTTCIGAFSGPNTPVDGAVNDVYIGNTNSNVMVYGVTELRTLIEASDIRLKNVKDEVSLLNPKLGERIIIFHGYKDELAYAAQLASDFYLMPCRFEPCGLTQMEAMAKGALPLAMSTGGLVDTIINGVDGFRTEVFFVGKNRVYGSNLAAQRLKNNVNAFADMLKNVLEIFYRNPDIVSAMKVAAMKKDFSWSEGAIQKYYNLFHYGI